MHQREQFGQALGEFQANARQACRYVFNLVGDVKALVYAVGAACDKADHDRSLT
ncbi:hypothetical protein ACLFLN_15445 [Acinetobacter pittii]